MELAPPNILDAALETVHYATVCARNWTCSDDFPRGAVNQLMDAIHEVPQMVRHWNHHEVEDILMHLNCFDVQKWRAHVDTERHSVPDFAEFFSDRLNQHPHD